MKKILFLTLIFFPFQTFSYTANVDAQLLNLKVKEVWISNSEYSTNATQVLAGGTTYVDFISNANLGSGSVSAGTYNCVIIKMTDYIQYKPSASITESPNDDGDGTSNELACNTATTYTADLCRGGESTKNLSDVVSSCAVGEDDVWLYLSTASWCEDGLDNDNAGGIDDFGGDCGNSWERPRAGNLSHGMYLSSPLVVSGSSSAKFIVNAIGKISGVTDAAAATCEMNAPAFGFENL